LTRSAAPSLVFKGGVQKRNEHPDILINNAGIGFLGRFENLDWQMV